MRPRRRTIGGVPEEVLKRLSEFDEGAAQAFAGADVVLRVVLADETASMPVKIGEVRTQGRTDVV